jgi:hypothetical protein
VQRRRVGDDAHVFVDGIVMLPVRRVRIIRCLDVTCASGAATRRRGLRAAVEAERASPAADAELTTIAAAHRSRVVDMVARHIRVAVGLVIVRVTWRCVSEAQSKRLPLIGREKDASEAKNNGVRSQKEIRYTTCVIVILVCLQMVKIERTAVWTVNRTSDSESSKIPAKPHDINHHYSSSILRCSSFVCETFLHPPRYSVQVEFVRLSSGRFCARALLLSLVSPDWQARSAQSTPTITHHPTTNAHPSGWNTPITCTHV